jgi:PAS domain-containing protein
LIRQEDEAYVSSRHTLEVRMQLLMSRSAAFEAQSAARDWLISQSPDARRAVESALASLERRLNAVQHLVQDNPEQISRAVKAHDAGNALAAELKTFDRNQDRLAASTLENTRLTDLQRSIGDMLAAENLLLTRRDNTARLPHDRIAHLALLSMGVGLLGDLFSFSVLSHGIVRRILAIRQNVELLAQSQPLNPMPESNDEIGTLARGFRLASAVLNERSYAFENAVDGMARYGPDRKIRSANKAFCNLLQRSPSDVIGQPYGFSLASKEEREGFENSYTQMRRRESQPHCKNSESRNSG